MKKAPRKGSFSFAQNPLPPPQLEQLEQLEPPPQLEQLEQLEPLSEEGGEYIGFLTVMFFS